MRTFLDFLHIPRVFPGPVAISKMPKQMRVEFQTFLREVSKGNGARSKGSRGWAKVSEWEILHFFASLIENQFKNYTEFKASIVFS